MSSRPETSRRKMPGLIFPIEAERMETLWFDGGEEKRSGHLVLSVTDRSAGDTGAQTSGAWREESIYGQAFN